MEDINNSVDNDNKKDKEDEKDGESEPKTTRIIVRVVITMTSKRSFSISSHLT